MSSRKRETEQQLRERIQQQMVHDIGISPHMAVPFVESVLRCFAGERPYFPAAAREYPVLHIRAALERGAAVDEVMREFDISRSKLHQLFPGGLPKLHVPGGDSTVLAKMATK